MFPRYRRATAEHLSLPYSLARGLGFYSAMALFGVVLKSKYRINSNNSRGNYQFFTFFPVGIIGGRELLEGGNY